MEKARQGMMDAFVKDAQEREAEKQKRFDHYFSRYSNHLKGLEVYIVHTFPFCECVYGLTVVGFKVLLGSFFLATMY